MERLSCIGSSASVATGIVAALNGLIVILKDEIHSFKSAISTLTGHHWTSHALILAIVFAIVMASGCLLKLKLRPTTAWKWVLWGNIIGLVTITGYYLLII